MSSLNVDFEMLPGILGSMIPIVAIVGGLGFAFASRYLKSKERMEMISRGMDISALKDDEDEYMRRKGKRNPLRAGMIWLGVGIGLMSAYFFCHGSFNEDTMVIYFGFVSLFVGLGLVLSHMLYKPKPEEGQKEGN